MSCRCEPLAVEGGLIPNEDQLLARTIVGRFGRPTRFGAHDWIGRVEEFIVANQMPQPEPSETYVWCPDDRPPQNVIAVGPSPHHIDRQVWVFALLDPEGEFVEAALYQIRTPDEHRAEIGEVGP